MNCLRGLIVSLDPSIIEEMTPLIAEVSPSMFLKKIDGSAASAELQTALRASLPSIAFLDVTEVHEAERVCQLIRQHSPGCQVIGFTRQLSQQSLLMAVRCSLRDVLESPFSLSTIYGSLQRACSSWEETSAAPHSKQIISFVPSKIGSGASTVALQAAFSFSNLVANKVALLDMDFDSGCIDFMLKLPFDRGLGEISQYGSQIDESIWSKVVSKFPNLDVMRSGGHQTHPISVTDVQHLLAFARNGYQCVCVDLPGPMNEHSCAVLEHSDIICLIVTPELHSVHLARRRMDHFQRLGVEKKVRVILNRNHTRAALTPKQIEKVLNTSIFAVIDNDYQLIQRALLNGKPLDSTSPLGRQFADMCTRLCGLERKARNAGAGRVALWKQLAGLVRRKVQANASKQAIALVEAPAPVQPASGVLLEISAKSEAMRNAHQARIRIRISSPEFNTLWRTAQDLDVAAAAPLFALTLLVGLGFIGIPVALVLASKFGHRLL